MSEILAKGIRIVKRLSWHINPSPNVTLETVERIASALNCRLQITVQLQK
jgi:hypothetical protein